MKVKELLNEIATNYMKVAREQQIINRELKNIEVCLKKLEVLNLKEKLETEKPLKNLYEV